MIDTADIILHHGQRYLVACVHGEYLRTAGKPECTFLVADCELIEQATHQQRMQALQTMAHSSMPGHRPECARQRLGGMQGYEIVGIGDD